VGSGLYELPAPGSGYLPASFEDALEAIGRAVAGAAALEHSWLARIRGGLSALLAYLDADADCARALVLEVPVGGATAAQCVARVRSALAPVLEEAREEIIIGAEVRPPADLVAELVTLAVLSVIRAGILRGDGGCLAELEPPLMRHVVEPYLGRGAERADREGAPQEARSVRPRMEMVPIRPHPRTIQALRVIGSAPRLSSREVGRAVGIENNSGHISMLLRRLQQRGLIEDASSRQSGRQSHTWYLTPYGARVLEVLAQTLTAASRHEHEQPSPGRGPHDSGPGSRAQPGRAATRAA